MASNFILKIQYENTLRRLAFGEADLAFSQLENRTRDLFRILPTASLLLTYTDKDGDVVTMADDDDLKDALVFQSINPLRINVKISRVQKTATIAEQRQSGPQATATDLPGNSPFVEKTEREEPSTESTEAFTQEKNSSVALEDPVEEKVNTGEKSVDRTEAVTEVTKGSGAVEYPSVEKVNTGQASAEGKETVTEEASSSVAEKSQATDDAAQVQPTATDKKSPGESAATENTDQPMHFGVQCDGCEMNPIKGARFKSTKRVNHDLCESCFENSGSAHDDYIKLDGSFVRMFYIPQVRRMMQLRRSAPQLKNCCAGVHCKPQANSTSKASESAPAVDATTAPSTSGQSAGAERCGVKHRGVQCDGCGMNPIVGPRLISRTKWNYDLCSGCFERSGGNVHAFQRVEEAAHDAPVVVGRVIRLASPYGMFGPRFGHYVWVLKQETAKNETNEKGSERQEKTEASAKGDLDRESVVKQA